MTPNQLHTGDDGTTGVLGDDRLDKFHPRIETLGSLDEASAALGLARSMTQNPKTAKVLKDIQRDLYAVMAEVAATPKNADKFRILSQSRLDWLDAQVTELETKNPAPNEFILPGDSIPGAALALARTIVRRAERRVAELASQGDILSKLILPYLNRLSLVCFHLEISENQASGQKTSLAKE